MVVSLLGGHLALWDGFESSGIVFIEGVGGHLGEGGEGCRSTGEGRDSAGGGVVGVGAGMGWLVVMVSGSPSMGQSHHPFQGMRVKRRVDMGRGPAGELLWSSTAQNVVKRSWIRKGRWRVQGWYRAQGGQRVRWTMGSWRSRRVGYW